MKASTHCIKMETTKAPEFVDITDGVCRYVKESQVQNGFAVVYSKHTTAAIRINENEPLLLNDMTAFLEKVLLALDSNQHGAVDRIDINGEWDRSGGLVLEKLSLIHI